MDDRTFNAEITEVPEEGGVRWTGALNGRSDDTRQNAYYRVAARRRHRPRPPHHPDSHYSSAALDVWARRIRAWADGGEPEDAERVGGKARSRKRDVFVFFDTDKKGRAPANATALSRPRRL